jgi:hypothetical protein
MTSSLEIIDRLPYELAARLEADPFFIDIPVVVFEEGNIKAEMDRKQALVTTKTGRRGVAVIVLQVVADDPYPDVMFNPLLLHPAFQVVELVELNRDPNGTGKSARKVARRIRDLLKIFGMYGVAKTMIADEPCIEPVKLADELGKSVKAYQVNFRCLEDHDELLNQCSRPTFQVTGATLELLSETADAEIYYTIEGDPAECVGARTYPSKQNPLAHLYNTALPIPDAGFIIRACAYPAGTTNAGNGGEPIDPALLSTTASWVTRAEIFPS